MLARGIDSVDMGLENGSAVVRCSQFEVRRFNEDSPDHTAFTARDAAPSLAVNAV